MNKRIFVRKKKSYDKQTDDLRKELELKDLEQYIIYDIFNIDEETYDLAKKSVFSEVMVDDVLEEIKLEKGKYFAMETLAAQYDQRADSAMQCISLLNPNSNVKVRCGTLLVFSETLSEEKMKAIEKLLVNPIESNIKNMDVLSFNLDSEMKELKDLTGFNDFSGEKLLELKKELSLAMEIEDLKFIQSYFKTELRDPSETEVLVLDCYWSDHCRHTTFETVLDEFNIESELFKKEMQDAFDTYMDYRKELGIKKDISLMDMASIVAKYHVRIKKDENIEVSEEINACSFFTEIDNNGEKEKWLIQFKNETHNHPTEIEPFGGASTCIGGAIRDPLSGRSYVYQAMRITGSANILQKREDTLKHKLAQVDISKKAASGYSSYGNQIGLATSHVKELYDDSYVAKHMELGAVVGAVKVGSFIRKSPENGDIVVVIGGRTGRDGIQGASGSSVIHTNNSLETATSQVQKGNAIEERKIQRLFRNEKVTKLIKKCNDFGAGGVCVAIGELAEGVEIHLDKVLVKYKGLNPTEIATSESQERMAVVIDKKDYNEFVKYCHDENIEYSHVATITDRRRLEMYYNKEKVVDMSYDFLATSGVKQHSIANLVDNVRENPFLDKEISKEKIIDELKELNVTSQKGLIQRFDASIGVTTVLMPFAGKSKLTPVQASVHALPTLNTTSDTATILTYGFIPKISKYSPFISSIYAVLESVAKVYAVGGSRENMYFSFQEYFEKLGKDPSKWGKVAQSLLGTIYAQKEIDRPSIGGKDSMSGSFNELNVIETLVSFACATVKIKDVITPDLKEKESYIYYVPVVKNDKFYPNISKTLKNYELVNKYIKEGKILSAYVQEEGSIVASLVKMGLGNGIGFDVEKENILNFDPASIILESKYELEFEKIGKTTDAIRVNGIDLDEKELLKAYTSTFNKIYPIIQNEDKSNCENISTIGKEKKYYKEKVEKVNVLIPVFPGTNCEYDTSRSFIEAGADTNILVFRNKTKEDILESIDILEEGIKNAHIIMFPGGFSSGDEPDGSAKFIVNVLKNPKIKNAINKHVKDEKLILGICNGFQALIKSGLIPYGEVRDLNENDLTLYRNDSFHHISDTVITRVSNTNSPWLQDFNIGDKHEILVSHGEGKLVGLDIEKFKNLAAFQYVDDKGDATLNGKYNPNGSLYAIEGLVSENGLVLGKMGHSERYSKGLYKTNTLKEKQDLFKNGVNYFKGKE